MGVLRFSLAGILGSGRRVSFLSGLPPTLLAAYFAGGWTTGRVNTVDKFVFPTDTRTTLGTGLTEPLVWTSGMANSGVAGYFGGGSGGADNVFTVQKFTFPADTRSTLGTGLSTKGNGAAGFANSGVAGYFAGRNGNGREQRVDKTTFSTDVVSSLGNILDFGRDLGSGMANSGVAGYINGTNGGSSSAVVEKLAFPADTKTTLGTGLSSARAGTGAMANSGVAGYFGGGRNTSNGTNFTTVDKFAFPTDTRTTLGTGISSNRNEMGGCANSGIAGYLGGGGTGFLTGGVATVDKFSFSDDTRTTLATGLSSARTGVTAMANTGVL
jgi:hypothetical protein